ncbi:Outer membrane protein romA [Acidisarcina polymorpha]|uniref:Outer membrane protein romA n=1 Tax=Acidisarcina polymorpha TaxID=2211140 RepID=A0A2Z5G323_9BACT|nr:MBL fold metallo-hydrolase [Acidisarcina polymorpha]AXC13459.1 Outer membrane protein romA [Acidisarcina polymorpha]
MNLIKPSVRIGKRYQNPVPTTVGSWSTMLKVLPRYLTNKAERTPKRTLGPFRTDIRIFDKPSTNGLRVTWIGHSSMLIEIDGVRVLVDPVWEKYAAPVQWAGPKRFFEAPLQLEEIPHIDVVLFSHDHYDHLGAGTVRQLSGLPSAAEASWVAPLGVGKVLASLGVKPRSITELNWMEAKRVAEIEITALPARHFSGRSAFNRYQTLWASFCLAGPRKKIYYGGDSGDWTGFEQIGRQFGPFDLVMLEIGAFDAAWADIHMGPDGAARVFRALGGKGLLMPIHWGLFDLALHPWFEPIERISSIDDLKIWSPEPGLPTEVTPGVELRSEWWRRK